MLAQKMVHVVERTACSCKLARLAASQLGVQVAANAVLKTNLATFVVVLVGAKVGR